MNFMPHRTHELAEQYEQLRNDAVSSAACHAPAPGLALFLRKGMTAWMQLSSQLQVVSPGTSEALPGVACPRPPDIRAEMTVILTGMILSRHQEVNR